MANNDTDLLVEAAQRQLDEHKEWLQMELLSVESSRADGMLDLAVLVPDIKLRVVKATRETVSIVWDYPDELYAFLSGPLAPLHLRASVAAGHVVSADQPASTAVREDL